MQATKCSVTHHIAFVSYFRLNTNYGASSLPRQSAACTGLIMPESFPSNSLSISDQRLLETTTQCPTDAAHLKVDAMFGVLRSRDVEWKQRWQAKRLTAVAYTGIVNRGLVFSLSRHSSLCSLYPSTAWSNLLSRFFRTGFLNHKLYISLSKWRLNLPN